MKLRLAHGLEIFFRVLASWAERQRQRFSFCPNCGRNKFTGTPCFGKEVR
jgi:hypothetical protein